MRFLLDTDSLIDSDKGKPIMLAVAKYPASSFVTSAVCAFEFDVGYFGFAGKASPYKIAHKGIKVLPLSKEIALEAARVLSQAAFDKRIEKSELVMLKMDALIAATAAIKGLKIVTKNTHDFNRMYQNIAVNWAGYT